MYNLKEQRYHKTELLSKNFQHPVFTPMKLVDEILDGLELDNSSQISILYSPEFAISLIEDHGVDSDRITLFTDGDPLLSNIADKMEVNAVDNLEELNLKRWSHMLGNPPYGRNSSQAIEFLNFGADHADNIVFVMPKTLRNANAMKRINSKLHLVDDTDNSDDSFDMELYTCTQTWEVRTEDRPRAEEYTKDMVKEDFEFTSKDKADVTICRVGRNHIGYVFHKNVEYGNLKNFEERSPNSHHFIKIHKKSALKRLESLQTEFLEAASNTVAQSALSKNDLIRIYLESK
jgi:hypothetical protein